MPADHITGSLDDTFAPLLIEKLSWTATILFSVTVLEFPVRLFKSWAEAPSTSEIYVYKFICLLFIEPKSREIHRTGPDFKEEKRKSVCKLEGQEVVYEIGVHHFKSCSRPSKRAGCIHLLNKCLWNSTGYHAFLQILERRW